MNKATAFIASNRFLALCCGASVFYTCRQGLRAANQWFYPLASGHPGAMVALIVLAVFGWTATLWLVAKTIIRVGSAPSIVRRNDAGT